MKNLPGVCSFSPSARNGMENRLEYLDILLLAICKFCQHNPEKFVAIFFFFFCWGIKRSPVFARICPLWSYLCGYSQRWKVLQPCCSCCWAAQGTGSFSYTEGSLSSLLRSLRFVLTTQFCLGDWSFPPNHKPLYKGNYFSNEPPSCWEVLSHLDWELPKRVFPSLQEGVSTRAWQ